MTLTVLLHGRIPRFDRKRDLYKKSQLNHLRGSALPPKASPLSRGEAGLSGRSRSPVTKVTGRDGWTPYCRR